MSSVKLQTEENVFPAYTDISVVSNSQLNGKTTLR